MREGDGARQGMGGMRTGTGARTVQGAKRDPQCAGQSHPGPAPPPVLTCAHVATSASRLVGRVVERLDYRDQGGGTS